MTLKVYILISLCAISYTSYGQTSPEELSKMILRYDSLFWKAYNACDTSGMKRYISDSVEFYHDQGGVTLGLREVIQRTSRNLCSRPNWNIFRQPIAGTHRVYPLYDNNVLYGAVLAGDHVFYSRENGKETLNGRAKFMHIWTRESGEWKMKRILSYDHGPM